MYCTVCHVLTKKMYNLNKSLWIKASAKCINVNLNVNAENSALYGNLFMPHYKKI